MTEKIDANSSNTMEGDKPVEIKPVSLEEILSVMDMRPDYTKNGNFMVYDLQRQEYISNWVDWAENNSPMVFSDASEAFDCLDSYISDCYFNDMQNQLEVAGVNITGKESLSDLCTLYKDELEKGNKNLDLGELNLAMGIVNPETVIYEQTIAKEKSEEKIIQHGEKVSLSLKQLYDNLAEKNGTFFFNERTCVSLSNGMTIEFDENQDDFTFSQYDKLSYYGLYDKNGTLICSDGEIVSFEGESQSGNLIFNNENQEEHFTLSKEEFGIASFKIETKQNIEDTFRIDGEDYLISETEAILKGDIAAIFKELDSGETKQNLTLNGVKIYENPEKDRKIKLLVEFDSKNPESKWREDSLFNALAEEKITFNDIEVDVNPITPEKSGTIEEYLSRLEKHNKKEVDRVIESTNTKLVPSPKLNERLLPFSIINNIEKDRINIKFDTVKNNPEFQMIIKELKANGWRFAPSTIQWYPIGKAVKNAATFANNLQVKYSAYLNDSIESAIKGEKKLSPYDGIRFFDRNYHESEEFAKYFNENIENPYSSKISEKDAGIILQAIGYTNFGALESRNNRLGLDKKNNLVIFKKVGSDVETVTTDLMGLLEIAKEKAELSLKESHSIFEEYNSNNKFIDIKAQDLFTSMYTSCIEQNEDLNKKMKLLYDHILKHDVSKENILYHRNSYRGWEVSPDKDFKKSVYYRSLTHMDKSGYILMVGKEGEDSFWQEKIVKELLKTNGYDDRSAIFETLSTVLSDSIFPKKLDIENPMRVNEVFAKENIKLINIDSGKDISAELFETHLNKKAEVSELVVGETIGKSSVTDVFKIADGVYQATFNQEINGTLNSCNYFVLDKQITDKLPSELQELCNFFDTRSVINNKRYEPYILQSLIKQNLMPPRDSNFIAQLDTYISANPLKYEKLKPINYLNFKQKLLELAEVDKDFNKDPLELGKNLITLVDDSGKARLNKFFESNGCKSESDMKKLFASWVNEKKQGLDNSKKNINGYPPRG